MFEGIDWWKVGDVATWVILAGGASLVGIMLLVEWHKNKYGEEEDDKRKDNSKTKITYY